LKLNGLATLFKLLAATIVFLIFFYSTTIAMTYIYGLDAAPLAFYIADSRNRKKSSAPS